MIYSQTGLALTENFEGCKYVAYLDGANVPTIGYGHTAGVKIGDTCTLDQAMSWLKSDIASAANTVNTHVKINLTQGEFDALVDFVFNLGSGNFLNSTLLKLINANEFEEAAQQFDRWDLVSGQVCSGILRRRNAETQEFLA